MTADVRLVLDLGEIDALLTDPEVMEALEGVGEKVARAARSLAPHKTGAGVESIEPRIGDPGEIDVSWDELHHYMFFHEVGTRHMPAHPFLAPALDYAHL